ncbi:dihydroorotase family protein [Jatrophihabitans telluris]|uniref:Dihydroorotase family protein n=1 Tax=Jatrophihabitans telluris TaxID=2038343 RepID=A0ABY4R1S7_9ACTN|nr:amidohydrolase family protein [Jatrophihabitans telluris]UQX88989.1 dihydroorotase family protein [Jatrophihabitans telluris]
MDELGVAVNGAVVVNRGGRARLNIGVSGGRIACLSNETLKAARTIDGAGLLALPGMVDTHVHLMDPGATEREDFPAGTSAAASRGVTTIIEHTHARPIRQVADLREKLAYLENRSFVDYGLAAHTWPDQLHEIPALWSAGVAFFKIFTCTTHGVPGLDNSALHRAFTEIAAVDARCLVHCEDESMTAHAEEELRATGRSDGAVICEWRSREAELVAVNAVCMLARLTGVTATIAHVSSPAVAQVIAHARGLGANIFAEACPQYFLLREEEILTHGALRKFTPPARTRSLADEADMWRLLRDETLSHVSSDHAPSTAAQKAAGTIWDAPFGLPGLDTTLPVLLDSALTGRISVEDLVRSYSYTPAARYGLRGKGRLAVGADADVVLVDPAARWTLANEDLRSKAGWSPYAGREFRGEVKSVLLRGIEIMSEGGPVGPKAGRFIPGAGARSRD